MIKKTVNYEDFDGNKVEETLYFNLTKAELLKLNASVDGGMQKYLLSAAAAKEDRDFLEIIRMFILSSYGMRSADGKRFAKSKEMREEFEGSEAYSEVLMSLLESEENLEGFIRGIMPRDLVAEIDSHPEMLAAKTGADENSK